MNHVAWFEITTTPEQKPALQDFYRKTFDWKIEPTGPMEYGMLAHNEGDPGIGGAVDTAEYGAGVVIYIEVDGIRDYVEKAKSNGAKVLQDVTDIPGMVTVALIEDPAGNRVGIMDAKIPE